MMKKKNLLLFLFALAVVLPCCSGTLADTPMHTLYTLLPGSESQAQLSYIEGVTPILESDGLFFKDLNGSGALDPYEDWRLSPEERAQDLLSRMGPEEKAGSLFCVSPVPERAAGIMEDFHIHSFLFNLNEDPDQTAEILNAVQAAAESTRLSVPAAVITDREYSFAGLMDAAHAALGAANDPDLAAELCSWYGEAMSKMGYHVTLQPQGVEIGSYYGENPEHIVSVVRAEIPALTAGGLSACAKYWIGRGGDVPYGDAHSVANNLENWLTGWKAAIDAGVEWIMTDCGGTGISGTTDVKWDRASMSCLRDTLGYTGIVISDRQALGRGDQVSGITAEGVDLARQSGAWLYNEALKNGTDLFTSGTVYHGTNINGIDNGDGTTTGSAMSSWPDCIVQGLSDGEVSSELVDRSVLRVLAWKFRKGLFEDPYRDPLEALRFTASEKYCAEKWDLYTNEDLHAARNAAEVELTERLEAASATLLKNDKGLLPLSEGISVYFASDLPEIMDQYADALSGIATCVPYSYDADVCVGLFSSIGEDAEIFMEDAWADGVPMVMTLTCMPTEYVLKTADAVLYLPYNRKPLYGTGGIEYIFGTDPWVWKDLLFGVKAPSGMIQKERPRSDAEDTLQWNDLAGDQGANDYVRLLVQGLMEDDPGHASPSNFGDPLLPYRYGMSYGETGEFVTSCLMLPRVTREVETVNSRGDAVTVPTADNKAVAGEPITVRCLLKNKGGDDCTLVTVYANDQPVAQKFYAVPGHSWRVVEMELILESGDYTLRIGNTEGPLTVSDPET